jgi:hypothetical protein
VSAGRPGSAVYPTTPLGEKFENIPTGRDVEWEPLVDFRRMDVSENTIFWRKCLGLWPLYDEAPDDEAFC